MNLKTAIMAAASCCLLFTNSSAFSQGLLTPPGPPGPTMLTLSQIEPRTPIATNTTPGDTGNTYIIAQSGSYYLTTNLFAVGILNGIEILANNVTLDLSGFNLQGVSNANFLGDNGIYIPNSQTNIVVHNGSISGWIQGVFSASSTSANLVFERLNFANCYEGPQVAACGMNILGAVTVRDCTFENNYYGLACNPNNTASGSLITGCTANDNSTGISCGGSGIISGCTANSDFFYGIALENTEDFIVTGCTANNNVYGIVVNGTKNRIENNHVTGTSDDYGIYVAGGTNNIIIRNSVEGSGADNYTFIGTQITGPMITSTGPITSANPWANFSF